MSESRERGEPATDEQRLWLEAPEGLPPPAELPRAGVLTIGSDPTRVELCLAGEGVAGVHCAVGRTKGGGWAVKDLGSSLGTFLNGARVEAARLAPGDELALGARRLRVVLRPGETRAPREPAPRIEGYRVLRRLGQGAMGQVWLAVQESLQREVALKVLAADVEADRAFVARFQAEARAAAALNHPNVVTVYDVGETAGLHYLSMEFMDAGNLEERVARAGPLEGHEVVRVLRDAAAGLAYAESKGIVHRDLKPANLMQNRVGVTKIADLGLATRAGVEAGEDGRRILGTPHFMAPEQVRGEKLDSRADLYALGATAYRLLSGRTPFEGATTRELLRAQLREKPRPLSEIAPAVPPRLAAVVERLLEKEPEARFPSAAALLRALEELERPAAEERPRRSFTGALLVLGLALAAALGAWLFLPAEESAPRAPRTLEVVSSVTPPPPPVPLEPEQPAPSASEEALDTALKLREAEARLALVELERVAADGESRAALLRSLAERFPGTAAATEAQARATELELLRASHEAASAQRAQALAAWTAALRTAAGLEGSERTPAEAFAALEAVSEPPALAGDPALLEARALARRELLAEAHERARAALAEAERRAQRGEFTAAQGLLEALPERFALPAELREPSPEDPLAPQAAALLELVRESRAELGALDERRAQWREELAREDARELAARLREGRGLTRELSELALEPARARLAALASELRAPAARDFAAELERDLARAKDALATLGREFSGAGWRRRTVGDPRDRRRAPVEALGADERGLLLPNPEGGGPELVPWSAFGADVRELHRLFFDRLQRPWSAEEQRSIAALLRLASVVEAASLLAPVLAPVGRPSPSERDLRSALESFESARGWAPDGDARERVGRELEVLRRALEVCELASSERPAAASARLEHLLTDFEDTLLVRLLSDGTGLGPRASPSFEPPPSEPSEPAGPPR